MREMCNHYEGATSTMTFFDPIWMLWTYTVGLGTKWSTFRTSSGPLPVWVEGGIVVRSRCDMAFNPVLFADKPAVISDRLRPSTVSVGIDGILDWFVNDAIGSESSKVWYCSTEVKLRTEYCPRLLSSLTFHTSHTIPRQWQHYLDIA